MTQKGTNTNERRHGTSVVRAAALVGLLGLLAAPGAAALSAAIDTPLAGASVAKSGPQLAASAYAGANASMLPIALPLDARAGVGAQAGLEGASASASLPVSVDALDAAPAVDAQASVHTSGIRAAWSAAVSWFGHLF